MRRKKESYKQPKCIYLILDNKIKKYLPINYGKPKKIERPSNVKKPINPQMNDPNNFLIEEIIFHSENFSDFKSSSEKNDDEFFLL